MACKGNAEVHTQIEVVEMRRQLIAQELLQIFSALEELQHGCCSSKISSLRERSPSKLSFTFNLIKVKLG